MFWLMKNIISYENNVMLAAILFLLVVILFVLLLHVYARWFLGQAHDRRASVFSPARRLAQTTTYMYDVTSSYPTKGLDRMVIDSMPVFEYERSDGQDQEMECAICLSVFEERERGRSLRRCSHAFHVMCIDMWLHSHTTCPICRSQVLAVDVDDDDRTVEIEDHDDHDHGISSLAEIVVEQNRIVDSSTEDYCSLRRMLSWTSRSEINRVHPSSPGIGSI